MDGKNYWRLWRRRVSRRGLLRGAAVGGLGVAAAAALGCGEEEAAPPATSTPAATASPSTGAATTTATAAAQPQEGRPGGTIRWVMMPVDPTSFDPYADFNYQSHLTTIFYYSRLYRFKTDPNDAGYFWNYEVTTDAAQALPEVTDGGQTYIVKLRPDIKWHNLPPMNGRQMTAEDVKFDLEFFMENAQSKDVLAGVVDRVEAPDNLTVVFRLKFPYVALPNLLAAPHYFYILPPEMLQRDGNVKNTHIGSGPFLFDTYEPGVRLVYKKNPDYYGKPYPYVDVAEGFIVNDPRRTLALFQSGQIGFMGATLEDLPDIRSSKPDATILEYIVNSLQFFYFGDSISANKPPFNDVRVRRAVSLAFDRDGYAELFYGGKGVWDNIINAGMGRWYLDPKSSDMGDLAQWFEFNPERARQLLQEAGYGSGVRAEFRFSSGYGRRFVNMSEAVLAMLNDSGFNLTAVPEEYGHYISNTFTGNFTGITFGPQTDLTEPDLMLFRFFSPDNPLNNSNVNDPEINRMLDAQRKEFDVERRKQIIWDIQRRNTEMMYYIPGVKGYSYTAVSSSVKNYMPTVTYGFADTIMQLWLAA